jgi:hypothetical protein
MEIDKSEIGYFTPDSKPFGLTYGQWTVKWWQWALSIPKAINPVLDESGKNADVNQNGPVWFLAGIFGENAVENKVPRRVCTVSSGKSILFPVINYEMNPLEKPQLSNEEELIRHVIEDIDDIVIKEALVDGSKIPIYRVRSDPLMFPLTINNDNSIGISGGTTQAAADGYWVFLKPLPSGNHNIYFHGACGGGTSIRNIAAEYKLTVS